VSAPRPGPDEAARARRKARSAAWDAGMDTPRTRAAAWADILLRDP